MEIKHPKVHQFYARWLPPIFVIYVAAISLINWTPNTFASDMSIGAIIVYTIGMVLFGLYLALVYWFLPPLIYPSANDTWLKHIITMLCTAITAGLGPVILYGYIPISQNTKSQEKALLLGLGDIHIARNLIGI